MPKEYQNLALCILHFRIFVLIFFESLAILPLKRRCMDMEEFSCKTRVVSGSGTIRMLGKLEKKKLFLVADPVIIKKKGEKKIYDRSRL